MLRVKRGIKGSEHGKTKWRGENTWWTIKCQALYSLLYKGSLIYTLVFYFHNDPVRKVFKISSILYKKIEPQRTKVIDSLDSGSKWEELGKSDWKIDKNSCSSLLFQNKIQHQTILLHLDKTKHTQKHKKPLHGLHWANTALNWGILESPSRSSGHSDSWKAASQTVLRVAEGAQAVWCLEMPSDTGAWGRLLLAARLVPGSVEPHAGAKGGQRGKTGTTATPRRQSPSVRAHPKHPFKRRYFLLSKL